jgi:hypothetical protein
VLLLRLAFLLRFRFIAHLPDDLTAVGPVATGL